jgi:hypothetical protein
MRKKLIIEQIKDCKLVYERTEPNGHDCWGNIDMYTTKHVRINDEEEQVFDDWWVMHDGKNVIDFASEKEFLEPPAKPQKKKKETNKTMDNKLNGFNDGKSPSSGVGGRVLHLDDLPIQETIKEKVQVQYDIIEKAQQAINQLRKLCKHPHTQTKVYSWGFDRKEEGLICSDCGEFIQVISNPET